MTNYWWVNQTYYDEKDHKNENISAAVETVNGGVVPTHKRAKEMDSGDIILCYKRQLGVVFRIGLVRRPSDKPEWDKWKEYDQGPAHKVAVHYEDLMPTIPLAKFAASAYKYRIKGYPINKNYDVQQGYIHCFNEDGLASIMASQETVWPDWCELEKSKQKCKKMKAVALGIT